MGKKKRKVKPNDYWICHVCEEPTNGRGIRKCRECKTWIHVNCCASDGSCHLCAASRKERE